MLALNYKTILGVALPMMVTGFIQSIVLLTDASLIARYSTEAFAAVGNALHVPGRYGRWRTNYHRQAHRTKQAAAHWPSFRVNHLDFNATCDWFICGVIFLYAQLD